MNTPNQKTKARIILNKTHASIQSGDDLSALIAKLASEIGVKPTELELKQDHTKQQSDINKGIATFILEFPANKTKELINAKNSIQFNIFNLSEITVLPEKKPAFQVPYGALAIVLGLLTGINVLVIFIFNLKLLPTPVLIGLIIAVLLLYLVLEYLSSQFKKQANVEYLASERKWFTLLPLEFKHRGAFAMILFL